MAVYLTRARLNQEGFSDQLLTRLFGDVTTNLDAAIERASNQVKGIVRSRLRNATEIGDTTTDEVIIAATMEVFATAAANRPGTVYEYTPPAVSMLEELRRGLQVSSDATPSIAEAVKASSTVTYVSSKTLPADMDEWGF